MASIVKKCDCQPARWRNCKHTWTVRYRDSNTRQREKSFLWNQKEQANAFAGEVEHKKRQGEYVDPKLASVKFHEAAANWVKRHRTESTRRKYEIMLRLHIDPVFGNMTVRTVSQAREQVETFLDETMPEKGQGASQVRVAYQIILAVVNDYAKTGKIARHRLSGLEMDSLPMKAEIPFPAHSQLEIVSAAVSEPYRAIVWLMRGCGLRIGEALAVAKPNLTRTVNGGFVLRITEQMGRDGSYKPLKHRKAGEWRDVPCPSYVAQIISQHATADREGRLFQPVYHQTVARQIQAGRDKAGLPGTFTAHTLRHIFASISLANGIPITDVSKWLGHRSINTTYAIYGHLVPNSWERAQAALDSEYEAWRAA